MPCRVPLLNPIGHLHDPRDELSAGAELQDHVYRVKVLVDLVQLHNVRVIQSSHRVYFTPQLI